jgi:exopolyphosphatase/guanosine-5'-triphosphate,3'-diphosphate pyrophosphatase
MRIAIIDLGTNTFNLLIAELHTRGTYEILYKNKIASKLGEGGINLGVILPIPFQRGLDAMREHQKAIAEYGAEKVYALATSAIRSAANGEEFIRRAEEETGIKIEIISGDREAELVYYGVRSAVKMDERYSLIMDIGGGSTEFIIADREKIIWAQSFQLGAARLLERFHESDPITHWEREALSNYLIRELQPLFMAVSRYPVVELIGSSGSFDSLAEMIAHRYHSISVLRGKTEYTFNLEDSQAIYLEILESTRVDRLKMKGLIEMRVDMIVVSAILIHMVIGQLKIPQMRLSTFSLKEGVLWELLHPHLAVNKSA